MNPLVIQKDLKKKWKIRAEGEVIILEFQGHEGKMHFGNCKDGGGGEGGGGVGGR